MRGGSGWLGGGVGFVVARVVVVEVDVGGVWWVKWAAWGGVGSESAEGR